MKIVFLDRATVSPNITFPTPTFAHQWHSYNTTPPTLTAERLQGATIAITNKVAIDRAILEQCPDLKYIAVAATGTNVIDIEACREHQVVVANITGYACDSVAEHTFMMLLALFRQLKPYSQALDRGDWQKQQQFCFFLPDNPIQNLRDKTLGLVGTGAIAQRIAQLAKAFGMHIVWHSPSGRAHVEGEATVSLNSLLATSDVVSLHCPLTPETHQLINSDALKNMRSSALLLNTARGDVVDTDALLDALDTGEIAGAGLDVLPQEPPSDDARIMRALSNQNLLVTPHTAWASDEAMQILTNQLMAKIEDYVSGKAIINLAMPL